MGATLVAAPWTQAQTPPATKTTDDQQSAYRSSIAQETARKEAEKIQAEIKQLATELQLNGMSSTDLALLTKATTNLNALSQEDMQKVINALQTASANKDGDQRQKALVDAFQGQKDITLKLKNLAVDLASHEAQREIPTKLQTLIARQSANIRQTRYLQNLGLGVAQLKPADAAKHDVASSEQSSIAGEIDLLFKALAASPAPSTPPADGTPDVTKTVLDALNASTLKTSSPQAVQMTNTGPFPDAVTKQLEVREALTSILRVSLSSMDLVSRLGEVKAQLAQCSSTTRRILPASRRNQKSRATPWPNVSPSLTMPLLSLKPCSSHLIRPLLRRSVPLSKPCPMPPTL